MNVSNLAIKFTFYAHCIASREWAKDCSRLLRLTCIASDIAQERRMQRVAQASLSYITGVLLWTKAQVLLHEQVPLAPIWMQRNA